MNTHPDASRPDVARKSQFAIVPMWVHRRIIATRTRTMALSVYVELVGQYAGSTRDAEGLRVWPKVEQIADSMEVPKSSVERALKVLIDCGVVLKKRTVRRNQYWLPQEDPEAFTQTLAEFQSVTSDGPHPQSVTSDGLDSIQSVTSDGLQTVGTDGPQSVTSDGLCNPDPSIQTQEISLSSVVAKAEGARARGAVTERETLASPTDKTNHQPATALPGQRAGGVDQLECPTPHVPTDVPGAFQSFQVPVPAAAPRPAPQMPQEATQTARTTQQPQEAPQKPAGSRQTAEQLVRAAAVVQPGEEPAFIAWATATHKPRGIGWWRVVAKQGDLPGLVADWRTAQQPTAQPAVVVLPPYCRDIDCDELTRMRQVETDTGHQILVRCPDCHPANVPAPVVSREQQATDDMFDRAMQRARARDAGPLPGTDTKVAGWLALADELRAAEAQAEAEAAASRERNSTHADSIRQQMRGARTR